MATSYVFRPPTVRETPAGFGRLFSRYPIHRGDSILITDGAAVRVRTPSVLDVAEAQYAYLGGHEYGLSSAEVTMLTSLGYGEYIETVVS